MQVKKSLKFALLDSNHLILHSQNNPLCQGHTETKKNTHQILLANANACQLAHGK
jgi:hypothetical protein